MQYNYFIETEAGMETKTDIIAHGKDSVNILIQAASLEEAKKLMDKCAEEAIDACRNFDEEAYKARYEMQCGKRTAKENMDEYVKEAEATPAGLRFKKTIENAVSFEQKHNKHQGLSYNQYRYLRSKHYNNLVNGYDDIFAIGYRRGYKDGQAAERAKHVSNIH